MLDGAGSAILSAVRALGALCGFDDLFVGHASLSVHVVGVAKALMGEQLVSAPVAPAYEGTMKLCRFARPVDRSSQKQLGLRSRLRLLSVTPVATRKNAHP